MNKGHLCIEDTFQCTNLYSSLRDKLSIMDKMNPYIHYTEVLYLAAEALWVPLRAEGSDESLHDGLLTSLASWSKLLIVALATEGLAVLLVEALFPKVLPTQSAKEMLPVPRLVQSSKNTLCGVHTMRNLPEEVFLRANSGGTQPTILCSLNGMLHH